MLAEWSGWLPAGGGKTYSELRLTTLLSYCAMDEFSRVLQAGRERQRGREGEREGRLRGRGKGMRRGGEGERIGSLFEEQLQGLSHSGKWCWLKTLSMK